MKINTYKIFNTAQHLDNKQPILTIIKNDTQPCNFDGMIFFKPYFKNNKVHRGFLIEWIESVY